MKISILNKWDVEGGAARAAYRLVQALKNKKCEVNYYANVINLKKSNIHYLRFNKHIYKGKLDALMQKTYINQNRTNISNTFFSFSYHGINLEEQKKILESDIINLHWVEKLISNDVLKKIVELDMPLVWTLHDMKPFTGGCHYSAGCREFEKECLNCKQLKYDPFYLPNKVLKEKIEILKNAKLTIITPSKWLAKEAKKSTLFKDKRVEIIPNSIEVDVYKPIDKTEAKKKIGIDPDKIILQFGAQDTKEKRKGFEYLIEAIKAALENQEFKKLCDDKKILILCMGHPSEELRNLPIESKELGFVSQDEQIALAYSATDLFILPTLEDNLPNTMLESFACKTPIVAFDTGGVSDVVKDGENGILVPKCDSKALAKGILELVFDKTKRENFAKNGRKLVESSFKLEDQANAYIKLFEEILQKDKKKVQCKNIELHEELYDGIIGYSVRKEIKHNSNFISNVANQNKSKLISQNNDSFVELKTCLEEVCKYSTLKKPIKKLKAYKKLINAFHEIK